MINNHTFHKLMSANGYIWGNSSSEYKDNKDEINCTTSKKEGTAVKYTLESWIIYRKKARIAHLFPF
jgi:hypothetical protein